MLRSVASTGKSRNWLCQAPQHYLLTQPPLLAQSLGLGFPAMPPSVDNDALNRCLIPPKPDLSWTRPPTSRWRKILWRWRMWVEVTFVLSMLEPWEKIMLSTYSPPFQRFISSPFYSSIICLLQPPSARRHHHLPSNTRSSHTQEDNVLLVGQQQRFTPRPPALRVGGLASLMFPLGLFLQRRSIQVGFFFLTLL